MKKLILLLLIIWSATAIAQIRVENNVEYKAVGLDKDDATFLALKDTAHKHLPQFIDSLKKSNGLTKYSFVIKSDYIDGSVHEHMWAQVYAYKDSSFKAIFIDSPFNVKNIKNGDKVTVDAKGIEDWVIYNKSNEVVIGNFSEKYLLSKE